MDKAKIQKEMPEFVKEVDGLSQSDLEGRLVQLAKDTKEVDDAKDADEGLKAAREEAASLAAPYRDAKKAIKAKSSYIVELLKEKN